VSLKPTLIRRLIASEKGDSAIIGNSYAKKIQIDRDYAS
jgi:hypothetical protein